MNDSLPPALAKIVQRFKRASEPKRRYEQLIWYAQKLSEFPEADKTPVAFLKFLSPLL